MNTLALLAFLALFGEGYRSVNQRVPTLYSLTPCYIWMNAKKANNAKGAENSLVEAFRAIPSVARGGVLRRDLRIAFANVGLHTPIHTENS
jgi:hypothetical protein